MLSVEEVTLCNPCDYDALDEDDFCEDSTRSGEIGKGRKMPY